MAAPSRRRPRLMTLAVVAFSLATTGMIALVVRSADTAWIACGAADPANKVMARFDLPAARLFWTRFPNAGRAPELEVDQPATIFVFDGPTTHPLMLAPDDPGGAVVVTRAVRDRVVCVYVDGVPNVYSNVDLRGFVP